MTKEIYISLSREDILRNWEWAHDEENQENGSRELHIFPALIEFVGAGRGSEDDNPQHEKFQFVQSGNSYGPDFDYSKISIYEIDDMFDEKQNNDLKYCDFNYSEVRWEARKDFAENHVKELTKDAEEYIKMLQEFKDEVNKNHLDENWEYYEKVNEIEDEWVQSAVDWNREMASAAMKNELIDEERGIVYKIVWED
jgi:hypothetical protein